MKFALMELIIIQPSAMIVIQDVLYAQMPRICNVKDVTQITI